MDVIAHGIDIVEVKRIATMLDDHGDRFAERYFTEVERAYADSGRRTRAERYAVRFACKEAVLKALGTGWSGKISWQDISISREPSGRPVLNLTGRCAELAAEMKIRQWHISLSHTHSIAIASVIACG